MQQWAKCILVLAWKMTIVGAQAPFTPFTSITEANCPPGFKPTCSGNGKYRCYLIYPTNNDGWKWKYKANEDPNDAESEDVYKSPNCYILKRVSRKLRTCNDAQRECEEVGGNITVINSMEESTQLTENVFDIIQNEWQSTSNDRRINFLVQNITENTKRCNKISGKNDDVDDITNTDCSTKCYGIQFIVCESTDVIDICPVSTTKAMQPTPPLTATSSTTTASPTPSVHPTSLTCSSTGNESFTRDETTAEQTSIRTTEAMQTTPPLTTTSSTTAPPPPGDQTSLTRSSTANQSFSRDETTAKQTSSRPTRNQSEMEAGQSKMEASGNLMMIAVVASIVVIAIIIILLSFLFIRRRQKRTKPGYSSGPNQHLPSVGQPIEDGNQDRDVHQNTLYNAVGLYQDTAAEVVYQDITNKIEYHDTAVEVDYHDTAVEVEYHDTAVDVVYQNSGVGRSKRTFTKDQFELEEQKELLMASAVGAHNSPLWSSEPSGHKDSDHRDLNVTNSVDCVDDIPYENSINAPERVGNVKGTEFDNELNEGYSEIDEFMLKEGGSTEADYLQIL